MIPTSDSPAKPKCRWTFVRHSCLSPSSVETVNLGWQFLGHFLTKRGFPTNSEAPRLICLGGTVVQYGCFSWSKPLSFALPSTLPIVPFRRPQSGRAPADIVRLGFVVPASTFAARFAQRAFRAGLIAIPAAVRGQFELLLRDAAPCPRLLLSDPRGALIAKDALVMLARTFAHIDSTESRMTTVDRLGFHVRLRTAEGNSACMFVGRGSLQRGENAND
jgi:hypothetical protein